MGYKTDYLNMLKRRINIRQFIDFSLLENRNSRSAFLCPFCFNQGTRLLISDKSHTFGCVDCGESGDVFEYVRRTKKCLLDEAIDLIADKSAEFYFETVPNFVSAMALEGNWSCPPEYRV
jgi:DNA primase